MVLQKTVGLRIVNLVIISFCSFYAPEIEDRGHIVLVLSVILSFCPPL